MLEVENSFEIAVASRARGNRQAQDSKESASGKRNGNMTSDAIRSSELMRDYTSEHRHSGRAQPQNFKGFKASHP